MSQQASLNQVQEWYRILNDMPEDVIREYLDDKNWRCPLCGGVNPSYEDTCSFCGRRDKPC